MENAYLCEISLFKPMLLSVLCEAGRGGDPGSTAIAKLTVMVLQIYRIRLGDVRKSRKSGVRWGGELALKSSIAKTTRIWC